MLPSTCGAHGKTRKDGLSLALPETTHTIALTVATNTGVSHFTSERGKPRRGERRDSPSEPSEAGRQPPVRLGHGWQNGPFFEAVWLRIGGQGVCRFARRALPTSPHGFERTPQNREP